MSENNPQISAEVRADGTGVLTIDGTPHDVAAADTGQARTRIIEMVAVRAAEAGGPLAITTSDPDGRSWRLLIHPNGTVAPASDPEPRAAPSPAGAREPVEEPASDRESGDPPQSDIASEESGVPVRPDAEAPADQQADVPDFPREHPAPPVEPTPASAGADQPRTPPSVPPPPPRRRAPTGPAAPPAGTQRGPVSGAAPRSPQPLWNPPGTPPRAASPRLAPGGPPAEQSTPLGHVESSRLWAETIAEHNRMVARRIAVISLKGGVGKTTTTIGLGTSLAQQHSERVIAVDANHYGTLADRFPTRVQCSMGDLARDRGTVDSFVALRTYLSSNPLRLHALAGGGGVADYEVAAGLAERFADTVVTDCRTDMDDPMVKAVLDRSTHCVIVLEPAADAVTAGQATLQWLASGYPALAHTCVMVICRRTPRAPRSAEAERRFIEQGHPVVTVPFDRHLHSGGVIETSRLKRATRAAYTRLAEAVTTR